MHGVGTTAIAAIICAGSSDVIVRAMRLAEERWRVRVALHVTVLRFQWKLATVSHQHRTLTVHAHIVDIIRRRALVVNWLRVWAIRYAEGPIVWLRRRVGRAAFFHVEVLCHWNMATHWGAAVRILIVHIELAAPRLVIHLGASRRGWHLCIGSARRRRILCP